VAINFDITKSKIIKGIWIIKPSIAEDSRGNIWTSFLKDEIENFLPDNHYFKHDKFSQSIQNVLRGIHGDEKSWKLVTCVYGDILQVVVDCRKESDTYGEYDSFEINQKNQISVLIPPRFGNAYYVRSKNAVYHYKLAYEGDYIDADEQFSYKWNDPLFNIKWSAEEPILSERDAK
jgi:dTDP-4-dehydrorhamnose 3,5-epimerase